MNSNGLGLKYETMLQHGEMTHYCFCNNLVWTGLICFLTDLDWAWWGFRSVAFKKCFNTDTDTTSAMFSAIKEKMQACAQYDYKRLVINSILRFRLFFQTRRRRLLQTVRGRTKEERGWEGGAKEEGRGREEDSAGWIRWSIWKTLIIYEISSQ